LMKSRILIQDLEDIKNDGKRAEVLSPSALIFNDFLIAV
jgi:hypothetical protein